MKTKLLTLLLVIVMIFGIVAGCSTDDKSPAQTTPNKPTTSPTSEPSSPNEEDQEEDVSTSYPIVSDGSITLDIWYPLTQEIAPYTNDLAGGENYAWVQAMEKTGVKIKFIHPASATARENFQTMIVSGDMPDILNGASGYYTGGVDRAIEDGVFVLLNPYEPYMPNYMSWVNSTEANTKFAYTDEGNMGYIAQVYDRIQNPFAGYGIRQDWLDDLNLERPETIDEWTKVLTEFRDKKTNGHAPLDLYKTGFNPNTFFCGAYGVQGPGIYGGLGLYIQKDGVVECSVLGEQFRDYLVQMNRWFEDGLIDRDFIANGTSFSQPNMPRLSQNQSGAVPIMMSYAGEVFARMGTAEEGAIFSLVRPPKLSKSDPLYIAMKGVGEANLMNGGAVITTDCENPEVAVRFIDWFYGEEGALISNYGIEGVTFNYDENNRPVHTELLARNPEGMAPSAAQQRYLIHNGFVLLMLDRLEDNLDEYGREYIELWADRGIYNIVGNLTYTPEEGERYSVILSDMQTYVEEFAVKCIMGELEINDSNWETFLRIMEEMREDECRAIIQSAYDRYLNR
ncbi:MAG: extracellular solute-binding protein [Eubacteriales bacterium]|jgi:putative aldouronate transport system substrate-binding protein